MLFRSPIAKLSQQVQLRILPKICEGIQRSVYSIIGKWNKGILHQDNYAHDPMKYSYEAHVVIRIPMDEQFLLAAARFSEIELRFSPRKNLHATSVLVKKYCIEFIARNNRSRTVEGDWMEKRIREAPQASCIAELLKPRIQNGMYHEQILSRLLDLVGKTGSQCRIFLDQVFKIYKIPQAVKDVQLTLYENKYGKIKAIMLSLWGLRNFSYTSNRRRTKKHARHAFSLCVLGSHEELKKLMEMRDARENKASKKRIETMVSGMKSKIEEDELDADIPF